MDKSGLPFVRGIHESALANPGFLGQDEANLFLKAAMPIASFAGNHRVDLVRYVTEG
jgi:hypothetical protein